MVSQITGTQTSSTATDTTTTSGTSSLDKDAFLKLLITQLSYQDPMSPIANEDFVAQLAQFGSLEQMQNINTNLEDSIQADYLLNQAMNNSLVTTLIGKDVIASSNAFSLPSEGEVDLGVQLSSSASSVKIKVYDASGNLVRTLDAGSLGSGEHEIQWDGKDRNGDRVEPGKYTFEVEATAGADKRAVAATTFVRGTITGVRYDQGVAVLLLGDTELNLGDVERILQSNGS